MASVASLITRFLLLWSIVICLLVIFLPPVSCHYDEDSEISVSVAVNLEAPHSSSRHQLARRNTEGGLDSVSSDDEETEDAPLLEFIEPGPLAYPMPTIPNYQQLADDQNLHNNQPGPIPTHYPGTTPHFSTTPTPTSTREVETEFHSDPVPQPIVDPAPQESIPEPQPQHHSEPEEAPSPTTQQESPAPSTTQESSPSPRSTSFEQIFAPLMQNRPAFRPRARSIPTPSSTPTAVTSDPGRIPPRGTGVNTAGISHSGCQGAAQTSINVAVTDWSGRKTTKRLQVHRVLSNEVQAIFNEIAASGFRVKSVGGYSCRGNTSNRSKLSNHAYGTAIDINPNENPYIGRGGVVGSRAYGNRAAVANRPGVINSSGPVVAAFSKHGWEWGGGWRSVKDYMHFEKKR